MKKVLGALAAILVCTIIMQFSAVQAAANADPAQKVTGILIDNACGAGMMKKDDPEAAAKKHSRACAMKESCEKSGYSVISGKKQLKFDEHGNMLAKEFLAKSDKTNDLEVVVEGTVTDGQIAVTSIQAAAEK